MRAFPLHWVCTGQAQLVDAAAAAEEPVLILLGALLETEWLLRSRYQFAESRVAAAFKVQRTAGQC